MLVAMVVIDQPLGALQHDRAIRGDTVPGVGEQTSPGDWNYPADRWLWARLLDAAVWGNRYPRPALRITLSGNSGSSVNPPLTCC